ncbi:MAG: FAD/NAD(P)-binding protein [Planctomycetes bacterium]|nr:FAD/NAD(P)-binding protein [Planctomycetota bacterium]
MTLTKSVKATVNKTSIYLPQPATLLESSSLTEHEMYFRFCLDDGKDFSYMPGQFMSVSVPGIGEAPISICSSPTRTKPGELEMVIRKVGGVTAALHHLVVGQKVGLRGPFGTTFPVDGEFKGRDLLFVCGGIGLVPVRSAIHYVLDNRGDYGEVTIMFGARTPNDRLFLKDLQEWTDRPDVYYLDTVDQFDTRGPVWTGRVGVITRLIPKVKFDPALTTTVICGPPIMYKFVLIELAKIELRDDRIFLSLERHMKCGVGKCGHCQINGLYACQKGPVFKYSEIESVPEAI